MRYFRIYHKKSKTPLTRLNEKDIVNFCIKNKETLSHYYFSELGSASEKNLLEWSAFALKYKELFDEKTKEREEKEKEEFQQSIGKASKKKTSPLLIVGIVVVVVLAIGAFVVFSSQKEPKKSVKVVKKVKKEQNIQKVYPLKRKLLPQDEKFVAKLPKTSELIKKWKTKKTIQSKLDPKTIKKQMDLYIPKFKTCFEQRIKAGDKNLHGELRLKLRISGDGVVRDVLIESDKFRSTYFGDCIIKAIKSKEFPMFNAKVQVFTYYFNL